MRISALFSSVAVLALSMASVTRSGHAQATVPRSVSPAAPATLNRPIFDTTRPNYQLDQFKASATATVVAEVDGRTITLGSVGDAVRNMQRPFSGMSFDALYPGVLGMLIKKQALVLRAQKSGEDEQADTKRRMQAAAEEVLTSAYIQRLGTTRVTEKMLLDRYAAEYANKAGPAEVRLRFIIVSTEQEAQALIAEIKGGADFGVVAKRASIDPSRANGGDSGFQSRDALVPEIGMVAFAMQPGQMTAYPIPMPNAWCILRVEERRQGPPPPFQPVRERLLALLVQDIARVEAADALATARVRTYSISGKEDEDRENK